MYPDERSLRKERMKSAEWNPSWRSTANEQSVSFQPLVSKPPTNEVLWGRRSEALSKPATNDLSHLWNQNSQISENWADPHRDANSVSSSSSLFYSPQESLGKWEWPAEESLNPFPSSDDAIRSRGISRPRTSTMPETRIPFAHSRALSASNPLGESWATPTPHPAIANRAISGTNHSAYVSLDATYAQKYSSQSAAHGSTSWSSVAASPKRPVVSTANRYISRQLKQGSREAASDHAIQKQRLKQPSCGSPIGIFVWGFPSALKLKEIVESFAQYGDVVNVGIEMKNGIKYAFVDYDQPHFAHEAFSIIPKNLYFGMAAPLEVRLRFDKLSKPFFDVPLFSRRPSTDSIPETDKRSLHLSNLPHNINKPEIEHVLSQVGLVTRVKIFQRAAEKKSSVFVTFKTIEKARLAAEFMKQHNLAFKEMKEPLEVEYPTQDISRHPPVFATDPSAVPTLSKKARKLLAASNTIAYARSPDPLNPDLLEKELSIHGPCVVYITKNESPATAFINFKTASACAEALASKTAGVTLPRHKRVDIPFIALEDHLRSYLAGVGDIKNITFNEEEMITTIEFLTAIGAARAIVRFQVQAYNGKMYLADYSPSLKPDDDVNQVGSESKEVLAATEVTAPESIHSNHNDGSNLSFSLDTLEVLPGSLESVSQINESHSPSADFEENTSVIHDEKGPCEFEV